MKNFAVWLLWRRRAIINQYAGARIHWSAYIDHESRINSFVSIGPKSRMTNSRLGRYTYVAGKTTIVDTRVGQFCSIGHECLIGGLAKHPTNWLSTHPAFFSNDGQIACSFVAENLFEQRGSVTVGNDVWIGARAMVLDGCSIGNGAIIAAGAVVVSNVEPYDIVGGVPARRIGQRFTADIVERIQRSRWWDCGAEELQLIANESRGPLLDSTFWTRL